ncbi:MAG: hypothetical protein K0R73_808 [Candidatus Midichloriaceae bacterium]|jgi:endonuclease/exonuclease/phosphatase family metal-dependent hydrolase|nr:hypothetical protein [Candidatus Midichloriaceae bacterium]
MNEKVKLLSFNIDTNISRVEEGFARDSHPEWRVGKRMPYIMDTLGKIIDEDSPTIIHIQECRKFKTIHGDEVDSVTPLCNFLREKEYEILEKPYNESGDKSFVYITAYKKNILQFSEERIYYLTQTPNSATPRDIEEKAIIDHNYGLMWERCIFANIFKIGEMELCSINVHLAPYKLHRMQSMHLLSNFINGVLEVKPKAAILVAGDFNSFPDDGGEEQVNILLNATDKNGLKLVHSAPLFFPDNSIANFSFIPFPYDFVGLNFREPELLSLINNYSCKKESVDTTDSYELNLKSLEKFLSELDNQVCKDLIHEIFEKHISLEGRGSIDRFFYRGVEDVRCGVCIVGLYDSLAINNYNDHEQIKKYILDNHLNGPAFASDHQPILLEASLRV